MHNCRHIRFTAQINIERANLSNKIMTCSIVCIDPNYCTTIRAHQANIQSTNVYLT